MEVQVGSGQLAVGSSKYKAYSEYKDSGVEWLGGVPVNWAVLRYKNILKIMQGMAFKSSEYEDKSSVINVRMGNIKKGGRIDLDHNNKYLPENYKSLYKEYQLQEGDAIIAMTDMSPSLDFLAVPAILEGLNHDASYLLNQRVGKLILDSQFDLRFVRYLLLSEELRAQLKAKGLGTVQANMSNDDLYNSFLFCPSFDERSKIANFLDHETAKTDTLIEEQQALIRLLQEKRQAVISHAVTKGLHPNAPMKDSGVEWLGEVPAHWVVKRIKNFGRVVGGFAFKSEDFSDSGYPVIKIANVGHFKFEWSDSSFLPNSFSESQDEYKAPKDSLIFAMTRPVIAGGIKVVKIADNSKPLVNQRVGFLSVKDECIAEYLLQSTQSSSFLAQFTNNMTITNQPNISSEGIEAINFPVPPKPELKAILGSLKKIEMAYENLLSEGQSQIEILQERRTALISAAVTGKIDVRDWSAPVTEQQ